MRRGVLQSLAVLLFATLAFVGPSHGGTIPLFNTGVDSAGLELAPGSNDPHWSIISGPGIDQPVPAIVVNNQALYAQDPGSQWIWVNESGIAGANTNYTFRLTFDLTGFDPTSAILSGAWGVDNTGQILLNGATPIGTGEFDLPNVDVQNFDRFHEFSITGGFVAGLNTLDFVLTDTGPPGAFAVTNLVGTAATTAVPEPASLILLAVGTTGFLANRARRRWTD